MKKENTKNKDYKTRRQIGMVAGVTSLFVGFMSWLQTSRYTFDQFDTVCKEVGYQDCMRWFWQTKGFFQTTMIIAITALVISVVWIIVNKKR